MNIEEALAREEIRDVLQRLAVLGDRGSIDAMMAMYAAGASFEVRGEEPVVGRDAIRNLFLGIGRESGEAGRGPVPAPAPPAPPTFMRHSVTNSVIDLDGSDHAEVTSYFTVINGNGISSVGRWFDSFNKVDGRWWLARRVVRPDPLGA